MSDIAIRGKEQVIVSHEIGNGVPVVCVVERNANKEAQLSKQLFAAYKQIDEMRDTLKSYELELEFARAEIKERDIVIEAVKAYIDGDIATQATAYLEMVARIESLEAVLP